MATFILFLAFFTQNGWELLSSVDLKRGNDPVTGMEIDIPVFNDQIRSAVGQDIELEGYLIPMDTKIEKEFLVLSRYPYQSCFFCGAAGPETVVEIYLQTPRKINADRLRVKGIFQINESDPLHLFYIIEDAKVEILD